MKLLAFTDLHANLTALRRIEQTVKREKPDILVNLGDFTVFEQNIDAVCKRIAKLHKKQLVLHGNHEEEATAALMAKMHDWTFCHNKLVEIDGITFVGFGGGGFSSEEPEFTRFVRRNESKLKKAETIVLLTHQPPYRTPLDHLYGDYVGNRTFTKFIKQHKNVKLALSGHIHETTGKTGKLNNAFLTNPGPFGKVFKI